MGKSSLRLFYINNHLWLSQKSLKAWTIFWGNVLFPSFLHTYLNISCGRWSCAIPGENPANFARVFYIFIISQIFAVLVFVDCYFLGGQSSRWQSKAQTSVSFFFWLEEETSLTSFMAVFEVQLDEVVWLNNLFTGKHTEGTKPICHQTCIMGERYRMWKY